MEFEIGTGIEFGPEINIQNKKKIEVKNESKPRVQTKKGNKIEKRADLLQMPEVESDRFFKIINSSVQGLKEYRLVTTALELGVFEALKAPLSANILAEKLGCDSSLMPHFCEALYSLGLLDRFEEGAYENKENKEVQENLQIQDRDINVSRDGSEAQNLNSDLNNYLNNGVKNREVIYLVSRLAATYLLENSPFSQQHYLAERLRNVELWTRLPQIMRKGPEIFEKGPFFGEVVQCMAETARCGILQETVRVVLENVEFKNVRKLLDLGGGHGLYAIAFAKQNSDIEAYVFDLPPVAEKTKQFIEKYDASNVDMISGDFFKDEIGNNYDLIFSSFNPGGKVPSLIPKIAAALNQGGIFVNRQVSDEKMKSSPFFNLDWNLWTFEDLKKGGSGYTFENSVPFTEYIEILGSYELEVLNILDMKDGSKIMFARKLA